MDDEKRWHDHRRNVERPAEEPWLDFKHDGVAERVEKVDRDPIGRDQIAGPIPR